MVYIGAIILFVASLVQSVVLPQAVPLPARPELVVMLVVAVCLVEGCTTPSSGASLAGCCLI